jgi:Concanavalin A-like lectin/glucanases superfamily
MRIKTMKNLFSLSLNNAKSVFITGLFTSLLVLGGCGSGSSESKVDQNPNPNTGGGGGTGPFLYQGEKPAATADIIKFQNELWVNIAPKNRCGSCHDNQAPNFAREDDINLAYNMVFDNNLVNLQKPVESRLVTKVAGGHNCWVSDASVCADIITGWITRWAGDQATQANSVELKAPEVKDIDDSKSFPTDSGLFSTTVYPVVMEYCSRCHSEASNTKQQPYFASDEVDVAYQAAKSKIRLDNPGASRLVQRLTMDSHNCWGDCAANGQEMTAAITAFTNGIPTVQVDPDLVVSKAVGLGDAFVLTSGGRIDSEIIAKYEFKTGRGDIAYDTSGSGVDLSVIGNVDWSSAWGVKVDTGGRLQATTLNSRKLANHIMSTGEYSIEAWVIPDSVDQGMNDNNPARIVSYSAGNTDRNFTLGQYEYNYSFLNRTDRSDANGEEEIHTPDDDQVLQATLQHVVVTFSPLDGRRIYVNGELIGINDPDRGAVLRDWENGYAFVLGNETTGATATQWKGSLRFVAMHKRALSAADIQKNFEVGVGARYLLLFNISDLIELPGSFIVFEVQQIDDYGYLFSSPFFTNLENRVPTSAIPLRGIRIGVNGEEAPTGQAFANLNTSIDGSQIVEGRQPLSRIGAIVEAKTGPQDDVFFLTFDQIGSKSYARVEVDPPAPAAPAVTPNQALIGVRNFGEINATLSILTGVSPAATKVRDTYAKVEQQLPTATVINGFLAAHQMGITQLAVAYCSELVDSSSLRASFFPGFNFSASASTAFDTTGRNQIIEPLLAKLLANEVDHTSGGGSSGLSNQANPAVLRTELGNLISTISQNGTTSTTVKAACSASLGSAVMLLQ